MRLDSSWMCPVHTTVIETERGTCRLCGRQLVPVTVALTWTCRGESTPNISSPGCAATARRASGSARCVRTAITTRRHGGQFFMAPDNWHHIEGAYPTRTIVPAVRLRRLRAAAARRQVEGRAGARRHEGDASIPRRARRPSSPRFRFACARNRGYLEARVDAAALPAEMTAKVRFGRDADEHRFDFTFAALTQEPAAPTSVPQATRRPRPQRQPRLAPQLPRPQQVNPATPASICRSPWPAS